MPKWAIAVKLTVHIKFWERKKITKCYVHPASNEKQRYRVPNNTPNINNKDIGSPYSNNTNLCSVCSKNNRERRNHISKVKSSEVLSTRKDEIESLAPSNLRKHKSQLVLPTMSSPVCPEHKSEERNLIYYICHDRSELNQCPNSTSYLRSTRPDENISPIGSNPSNQEKPKVQTDYRRIVGPYPVSTRYRRKDRCNTVKTKYCGRLDILIIKLIKKL